MAWISGVDKLSRVSASCLFRSLHDWASALVHQCFIIWNQTRKSVSAQSFRGSRYRQVRSLVWSLAPHNLKYRHCQYSQTMWSVPLPGGCIWSAWVRLYHGPAVWYYTWMDVVEAQGEGMRGIVPPTFSKNCKQSLSWKSWPCPISPPLFEGGSATKLIDRVDGPSSRIKLSIMQDQVEHCYY